MRRLIRVAVSAVAAACLLPNGSRAQSPSPSAPKALVYCPITIDSIGCSNITTALAARYPTGVDRGYDGTMGTVDLKTVDLWQYDVLVVPSLADGPDSKPYALLRDATIAERLHDALMGRVAMWSGTPDLGSASSANREQKNALIANLATWAAGNYAAVKGPGLVTFLDQSDVTPDRYGWIKSLASVDVAADTATQSYASVSALTATAQQILTSAGATLAFSNMASFGFALPNGSASVSLDAIGQTGTSVGGQVVLITSSGGNSGGAIVKTDRNDYAPGTTVSMTGSGWQAGETVTLTLHEDPLVDPDRTFSTVADANRNISFTGFAPERHNIGVRFILTATGQVSGLRAQTTFTDNVLLKTISFWIHAHEDDWQLFMSDQTRASAQTADNIVFVYVTAGDNGQAFSDPYYWQTREAAAKLSVDVLLGDGEWNCAKESINATVNGALSTHPIERCVKGKSVSYFLRLPDGGLTGTNNEGKTLPALRDGSPEALPLSTVEIPSTTSYQSWDDLVATIRGIVDLEATRSGALNIEVNGPEYDRPANPEDHPDHLATADLVKAAATGRTWSGSYYTDYYTKYLPPNLSDDARTFKNNVFGAYDHVMAREGYQALIGLADYQAWLGRTYVRAAQTAPVAQVPVPATSLTAQPVSESEIDLAWTDNSSFETGFRIERAADAGGIPGQFTALETVPANTTKYNNIGLAMGTYWYRVMAVNASGDASAYTNQVSAQTAAAICVSPSVSISPVSLAKNLGEPASFTAVPTRGTAPFSYRWQKDGIDVSGATGNSYSIATVTATDVGSYTAIITNSCGSSTSNVATLTLNQRTPVYSGLTSPLTITYGTASVTVGGALGAGGQYPTGAVSVTLGSASVQAAINASNGAFTATFATNTLGASVTPYAVTYSYAGDGSFLAAADNNSTTVTVEKATQTIVFTSPAPNATYGGSYSPAATGGGSGNAITFATTTPTVCTSSGTSVHLVGTGSCTITADQAGNANFEAAAQQRQTFSVGAATATIAITNTNPIYDGTTRSASISVTGADGSTLPPSTYSVTYSQNGAPVAAPKNAGSYEVTVAVTDPNYTGTRTGPFSIARAPLQVAADAQTKVYGTADPALTYKLTLGVLAAGDALSGVLVRAAGETVAGSPYAITQGTLTAGPNYDLTVASAGLTITRRNATITSIAVSDKSYDGTPTAAFLGGVLAGLSGEDNVTLTAGTATFADKHVGDQKSVTVMGLALAGPDAGNYSLAATTGSTTASIHARAMTISAAAASKVYDGTPAATVTLSDDRIAGDQLTTSYSSASFTDKNAGASKTISVSGITLQGSDRGDYTFNSTATATAAITARQLDVSAVGADKVYDGTTTASVALSTDKLSGDVLTVTYSASFTDKNVGQDKPVAVTGLALGGSDAANYVIGTAGVTTTANISARPIAVTADAQTKSYGAADPSLTYSLTSGSLAGGDLLTGVLQRLSGEDVGTYAIQQGSLTAGGNYLLSVVGGTLTITPATATISIDPATLLATYDGMPKSVRLTTSPANAAVNVSLTYAGSATPPRDAGRYEVLATITSGNYTATAAHATLVIAQATATITITDPAPVYKATPTSAVVAVTGADGVALSPSAYAVSYTLGGTAVTAPTNAGHYIVTVAVTDANYSGSQTGTLTIAPVALTVSADPQTKLFGASDPAFSYRITNGSLVASDQLSGALTRAPGETVAGGPYAIRQGTLAAGPNYLLSFVESSLTITPASATVTLGNLRQTYDGAAKGAAASTSPANLTVQFGYTQNSVPVASPTNAGSYDVIATVHDPNYQGTKTGTLVIIPATQTLTFTSVAPSAATYGGTYTPAAAGGASGNPAVFGASPGAVCAIHDGMVSFVGVGDCTVTADQAGNGNYGAATQITQRFAVGRAPVNINIVDPTPVYDGTAKTAVITATGIDGATLPASAYTATYTLGGTTVTAPKNAGQYSVAVTVTDANYGGSQAGTLTIKPVQLTVTADGLTKVFGAPDPALTYRITNGALVGSDQLSGSLTRGSGETVAGSPYAIHQGSLAAGPNYALSFVESSLTITPGTAAITLGNLNQTYDGAPKAATASTTPSGLTVTLTHSQNGVAVASPTNAGSYDVLATIVDANYRGSQAGTMIITKALQTIAFTTSAPTRATFGGSYTPTATGGGSGNAVVFGATPAAVCTISGGTVSFVGLGDCVVTADQASSTNYAAAVQQSQHITVGRATAAITITDPAPVYDGTVKGATITVTGVGGAALPASAYTVAYTLGSAPVTAPKNVGQYTVTVSVTDPNYSGSETGTLTIARAGAMIALGNLSQAFDGSPKTATATTTPAGLSVALSYAQNGVTVANPTNAGSYDVVATVNDANYQGSKTGTLVIARAAQTITFTSAAPTDASYGGTYRPSATGGASGNMVTFATTTGAVCTISGDVVSFIGIGDCIVTAEQAGGANYADAQPQSQRFAVGRATATITITNPSPAYDGTTKAATIVVTGIEGAALSTSAYTVTYALGGTIVAAPKNAGQYAVTVSVTDPQYTGIQTGSLTIVRAAAVITLDNLSQIYDGMAKGATATTNPSGLNVSVTYSQNGVSVPSPTKAGSYDVVAIVSDVNYQGSKSGSLVIAPATQTVIFTSAAPSEATYGGSYTPSATGGASGAPVVFGATPTAVCTITGGVVNFVGVGDCVVTADQAGSANYSSASRVTQHFAIGRATASVTITDPAAMYDATSKAALISVSGINGAAIPASGYTVTYMLGGTAISAPTSAGQYAVAVTVTDPNYVGSQAGSLTIKPVELTITADAQSKVFGATDPALTYRITKGALVGADQLGGALTRVAGEAVAGGPYAIQQGTLAASANYLVVFVASSLTITPATATLSFDERSLTATYDGSPKAVTLTTSPTNLTGDVTLTYAGSSAAPTNAGSYDVVATLANGNYAANPARATLVIAKATQTVAFTTAAPAGAFYGGSYTPAITGGASANAVVLGTKTPSICGVNGATVVFTGTGTCTLTANQSGNANYAAAAEQTQSFSIAAAALTVTADPQTKVYGAPDPALTFRITSGALRSGDQLSGVLSRTPGEAVSGGPYAIQRGTLSAGSNYLLTFVGSALTITPAAATITLGNLSQSYDGASKVATASTSPSGLTVGLTYSQNGVAVASPTNAGSYTVVATINEANYQGTQTGTLVIRAASLTIVWNPTVTTLKDPATLSTSQLNATIAKPNGSPVSGTVTYTMAGSSVSAGARLPVGLGIVITASFTSTDPNYGSPPDVSRRFDVLTSADFLISNPFNIIQLSDTKTTEYTAAFITTANFDASTVDPATALLGDGSDSPSDAAVNTNANGTLRYSIVDVNSDGKKDMLLYFKRAAVNASGITTATTMMVLRAQTKDGRKLKGTDKVTVAP